MGDNLANMRERRNGLGLACVVCEAFFDDNLSADEKLTFIACGLLTEWKGRDRTCLAELAHIRQISSARAYYQLCALRAAGLVEFKVCGVERVVEGDGRDVDLQLKVMPNEPLFPRVNSDNSAEG